MRRAVFLDRDGVLNRAEVRDGAPRPPSEVRDVAILPGVEDACRRLADAGWLLFVVTNQPDIARGTATRDAVDAINETVVAGLPVTEVVVCPHDDSDACSCRKPLPGMLLDTAARWDLDLTGSVMVGDRWRDVEAGKRAGVRTMFIDHGYAEALHSTPDHVVAGLADVADLLLDPVPIDDWESHWSEFADSASDNPAQAFRRELIGASVERAGGAKRLVDIGSGQGDLLASLHDRWPAAELVGLELSAEGIRRAREKVSTARFFQIDLLTTSDIPREIEEWADVAVCSEVLEHVDDPVRLLRTATRCLAPDGLLVLTVPGGPRTAFDRFIGHRRHFRTAALRAVLREAGLDVERVSGAGFPFFNLYKLVVLLRGRALVRDVSSSTDRSWPAAAAMRCFGFVLTPRLNSSRFGWQLTAETRRRPLTREPGARSIER
jgi:histidinol-phosphate phosphatase family protein